MTDENNKSANSTLSKPLLMVALCALAILGLAACDDPSTKPVVSESSTKPAAVVSKSEPEPDDDGGANGCTISCTNHLRQITISPGRYACVAC